MGYEPLLRVAVEGLAAMISLVVVPWVIHALRKHRAIALNEAQERRLESVLRQAVGYAEQRAKEALKDRPDSLAFGPESKLEIAKSYVDRHHPEAVDALEERIQAEVGHLNRSR